LNAERRDDRAPFVSVYSFPSGHTKQNNIPRIDTLFIDFDFESGDYERGSGNVAAWRRDLSHLLVRARRVAEFLKNTDAVGWRASLSGHKGVHLFVDFPAVERDIASFQHYLAGVGDYANGLVDHLSEATGLSSLHDYVDVTSSDLGRLCRAPNTLHSGATESFGEERYCVPVSISELASLSVDDYIELTRKPRAVPYDGRTPNAEITQILEQHIRTANPNTTRSTYAETDYSRVDQYQAQTNDDITLEDVKFLTSDRPCVWKFHKRDDKFDHGHESHAMELFCVQELICNNVPIDVIKEFLSTSDKYDPDWTENFIRQVIARNYNRFGVSWLHDNAQEFCQYDSCSICSRAANEH